MQTITSIGLGKRAATVAANRELLLATAKTLFDKRGYERTTLRDIANEARLTTSPIFVHWKSKDELYKAVYGHEPISPEVGKMLWHFLQLKGFDPVQVLADEIRREAA